MGHKGLFFSPLDGLRGNIAKFSTGEGQRGKKSQRGNNAVFHRGVAEGSTWLFFHSGGADGATITFSIAGEKKRQQG